MSRPTTRASPTTRLWPLYHDAIRESGYHEWQWEAYVRVNRRFADTLAEVAPPDAIVWIHDYHLQLVPQMLRDRRADVRIGFFNHIPFPPYELFARIPWREEIVKGLLGADLLGFQRQLGAQNFIAAASATAPRPDRGHRRALQRPRHARRHVPDLDRRRGVRDARCRARDAPASEHHPGPPGRPGGDPARRRPPRLHQGHWKPPPHVRCAARQRPARSRAPRAGAGGHTDPRSCRPVHRRAPRHRARRR